jgi:phosphopantothenate synthetase
MKSSGDFESIFEGAVMIDQKLLQSIGNLAARDVENHYPQLNVRFLALRNGAQMKAAVTSKGDKSGRTVRLFDLQPLGDVEPTAVKEITDNLVRQLERAVQDYNEMWNRA